MGVGTRDRWADVVDTSSEGRDEEAEVDDDGCVAGFDVVASMRECAVAWQLASSFTTLKRAHGRREFAWLPKPLLAGPLVQLSPTLRLGLELVWWKWLRSSVVH